MGSKAGVLNYVKQRAKSALVSSINLSNYAPSPRSIGLDFTWECNLNCIMCAHRVIKLDKKNLSSDEFKHILSEMPNLKQVNLVGLGEPLMNPYFFEVLDIARSRNIKVAITTNGTLLNEENIKRLNDSLSRVVVSIDTPYPANYEAIRRGAKLSDVIENVKKLKDLKSEIEVEIQAIIMKDTIEGLPKLVELARDLKARGCYLLHIASLDPYNDRQVITSHDSGASHYLKRTEELAKNYGMKFVSRPLQPEMKHCLEPWFEPFIALNGDIYPCCFIYRIPEPFTEWHAGVSLDVPLYQYRMGNIFKDSFKKIWKGDNFKQLRKAVRESEEDKKLSLEEFNLRRQKIDPNKKFSYCQCCLWRWGVAC